MYTVISHYSGDVLYRGDLISCDFYIANLKFRIIDECSFAIWVI